MFFFSFFLFFPFSHFSASEEGCRHHVHTYWNMSHIQIYTHCFIALSSKQEKEKKRKKNSLRKRVRGGWSTARPSDLFSTVCGARAEKKKSHSSLIPALPLRPILFLGLQFFFPQCLHRCICITNASTFRCICIPNTWYISYVPVYMYKGMCACVHI